MSVPIGASRSGQSKKNRRASQWTAAAGNARLVGDPEVFLKGLGTGSVSLMHQSWDRMQEGRNETREAKRKTQENTGRCRLTTSITTKAAPPIAS